MAYTPTTWTTGDDVTATLLNKMENGIANAGSALIVTTSWVNGADTMDKTVREIYDALSSGTSVYYKYIYGALGTTYVANSYLSPIVGVYGYSYTDTVRVIILEPKMTQVSTGSGDYLFAPNTLLFQASGMDEYPTFYKRVITNSTALSATT